MAKMVHFFAKESNQGFGRLPLGPRLDNAPIVAFRSLLAASRQTFARSMTKVILSLVLLFSLPQQAQQSNVFLSYQAPKDHELNPDPDCDFWKQAKSIVLDRSILGELDPSVRSEARSRWTEDYLYLLFWGPFDVPHLKPDPETRHKTYKLWFYDDFELYLGANFDNINLYDEFEISPQSEFLDMAIDASREKPGWNDEYLWNSGMTVKSRVDKEKKIWYGEMRIPIVAIDKRPAVIGNEFRVNVYRLQSAGAGQKIQFLAWQPTGEWNPHRPKKFGTLRLTGPP
jgi:Carbohydrate family 9 binding domain-like